MIGLSCDQFLCQDLYQGILGTDHIGWDSRIGPMRNVVNWNRENARNHGNSLGPQCLNHTATPNGRRTIGTGADIRQVLECGA